MTTLDDLLGEIFSDQRPGLYGELERWARDLRRFRAFLATYQPKIRAKVKNARDPGMLDDLRAELATAALLLGEERFSLEYEKYAAAKQRGPDFSVTFKTHTLFNIEVRRIRHLELEGGGSDAPAAKLVAVLSDKVGQMAPGVVNFLWLVSEGGLAEADVAQAAVTVRQLAERKVEEYFTRRGFQSAAGFLRQYRLLSGVILRQQGLNSIWLNPLARHKAPPEIVTALQRLESR
jgi:hypothetical protein